MSEYWKSTPKYWCKHCSIYVRDTKLERANHESTGKHQGAIKRSLRDLHRGHEREEREKERAKREVDRLNGIVSSTPGTSSTSTSTYTTSTRRDTLGPRFLGGSSSGGATTGLSGSERKRQAEQLASLGVSIPDEFRKDLAMAGEWTVTNMRIIPDKTEEEDGINPDALATGVRKRERTEDEIEQEQALNTLSKKPRKWGRDPRAKNEDLDVLLSGGLIKKEEVKSEEENKQKVKKEEEDVNVTSAAPLLAAVGVEQNGSDVKREEGKGVKKEPQDEDTPVVLEENKNVLPAIPDTPGVRAEKEGAETPAVVFKKPKPKHLRQK